MTITRPRSHTNARVQRTGEIREGSLRGGVQGGLLRSPARSLRRSSEGLHLDVEEFTEDFIVTWLDDWYLRSPSDPGLLEQMNAATQAWHGVTAATFTEVLVAALCDEEELFPSVM